MKRQQPKHNPFYQATKPRLSHVTESGSLRMVDVSHKEVLHREAEARGFIALQPATLRLISTAGLPKGDVLVTAKIAGIQAVKRTAELIPMCHPLPIDGIELHLTPVASGISITCRVKTDARTGVEMEALTGVSVAALTVYDMCKAVDDAMVISEIALLEKQKLPRTEAP